MTNPTFEVKPRSSDLPPFMVAANSHKDAALRWAATHDERWQQAIVVDVFAVGSGVRKSYTLTAMVQWSAAVKRSL